MNGRLLRFLDKGVEHDYALADKKAVERPTDTRPATRPQLKQPITEGPRVRQFQVGSVLNEQLDNSRVVSENLDRPRLDLGQHPRMEILNRKRHK